MTANSNGFETYFDVTWKALLRGILLLSTKRLRSLIGAAPFAAALPVRRERRT